MPPGRYHRAVSKRCTTRKSEVRTESKLLRLVKVVPWVTVLRVVVIVGRRWTVLSVKERARVVKLVRKSRGRLGNLSVKDRLELSRLARKLDLRGMGTELVALKRGRRRGRRRRKR
jgi:hypothetical protein